jgi:hypothetical protein
MAAGGVSIVVPVSCLILDVIAAWEDRQGAVSPLFCGRGAAYVRGGESSALAKATPVRTEQELVQCEYLYSLTQFHRLFVQ